MFTGIIEEVGKIRYKGMSYLKIEANKILKDIRIGDSVAVNGFCLTVTDFDKTTISLDVMNETLGRTNLRAAHIGNSVNLERAMPMNGRFGGHIVSGHIDGVGKITSVSKDGIALWFTVAASDDILRGIVMKGSVAIDGVSLTVAETGRGFFKVSVIPHTQAATTLLNKNIGDTVNIETDIIGKYIEKFLCSKGENNVLDMDTLVENGF